jgi:ectoine utilization protein EutC
MVLVLDEKQLRELAGIDSDALEIVEQSFKWIAEAKVDMPPIMHMSIPENNGDIDIKSAYVQGLDSLTVKLGSGFFNNPGIGLPSSSSTMVVMSTETGLCEAVLLENGYLTNLRTGMAGAVAAKYLAPATVETVGVIGAGVQGRFQLECLQLVRDFSKAYIYSRRRDQSEVYALEMSKKLGIEIVVCETAEEVVRESQLVVTTTSTQEPVIQHEWLHEGLHITAMGSDVGGKQELTAQCLNNATLLICDSLSQCLSMGELQHALNKLENKAIELSAIVADKKPFVRSDNDITICDLTGMGVQDTAIASLVMSKYKKTMA